MSLYSPDSTAFALSIKNFGQLPSGLQETWSSDLLKTGKTRVPMPRRLIVELLNSCNYDCPMCRVGRYGVNYSRKMSLPDLRKILDDLTDSVEEVRLNGLGESTILPDFQDYVRELIGRDLKIELISNGSGRLEDYEMILRNKGIVIVSWDAASKEKFEILRRPAKWEDSVKKLVEIATISKRLDRSDRLFLMFTLQKTNIEELSLLVDKCETWGIRNLMVNVVKLPNTGLKDEILRIRREFKGAADLAIQKGINLILPDQVCGETIDEGIALITSSKTCVMPWEEAVVRWNGDVQVCNMFNPYIYGNIWLNSFKTIWNNAYAQIFRKNVNTGNKHPYCDHCVYMRDAYNKL